jgi:two-component system, OmpR family, phosphate regulon response regulator PhoB
MKNILIADDNPEIRRLFSATFGKFFEVFDAENGQIALDRIRVIRPDIVFLDVMMPGELNGLQVLSAIREDPKIADTTVYMVTGRDAEEDFSNAKRHGADGYIIKPFSTTDVMKIVRQYIADHP